MSTGDGKFATLADVMLRYEGDFPTDRQDWLAARLADVEAELMGQVPSLRKPLDVITADSATINDPSRLDRIKTLVCNKTLDLFRNPEGVSQLSRTMPDITTSRTFTDPTAGRVAFTDDELDGIRLHTNRPKFGSYVLNAWSTAGRACRY